MHTATTCMPNTLTSWFKVLLPCHRGLSIPTQNIIVPSILPRVMLRFAKTHLYPEWKLHSNTNKDEIESSFMVAVCMIGLGMVGTKMNLNLHHICALCFEVCRDPFFVDSY